MHAKNRLFTGGLAVALAATLLPGAAAAAELVPGRPGRYELSSIAIDATSGDCRATYETPAEENLWMRGVESSVRVLSNPRWVHVTCRFADMSRLIEGNAEVGYTDACTLVTEAATYTDGWGIATSAANIGERAAGGNSMAMCRFRVEPPPTVAGPGAAAMTARAMERAGPTGARGRGKPAAADDSSSTDHSRGARAGEPSTTQRDSAKTHKPAARSPRASAKAHKATKAKGASVGGRRGPSNDKAGK
jgi:hypothetical protein